MQERLNGFNAQHARCFLEEDRERLLGIIEEGFGDYAAFNILVRGALLERSRKSGAQRALQAAVEESQWQSSRRSMTKQHSAGRQKSALRQPKQSSGHIVV